MITLTDNAKKILLRIISMVLLMEMLDATVLNTALPQIAVSLHVNPIQLKEILTIYFLSLGIFIPVSGWVSDRFGEKKSLIFAVFLFTISSIGCGLAINLPMLVFFRCLQGVGGAFLMPIGRQIMVRVFSGMERIKAMSRVVIMTFLGLSLGPLLGGAITTYLNWRWIFFINVPVSLICIYYIFNYLPTIREKQKTKFDLLGFIFIGFFLGALLFLLDTLVDDRVSYQQKLLCLIVSFSSLIIYIQYAKYSSYPLISLKLFQQGNFKFVTLMSFLVRLTVTAQPFLVPLLLQTSYGYSALKSGILMTPTIAGNLLAFFLTPFFAKNFYHLKSLVTNAIVIIVIFSSFYWQAVHLMIPLLILQQFLFGFFVPLQMSLLNNQAYDSLREPFISSGTSVYSGIIQISGGFGIALAALCITQVTGVSNLDQQIPLIGFKVVFLVQNIYLILGLFVLFFGLRHQFTKLAFKYE